jgi:hypothetical protein
MPDRDRDMAGRARSARPRDSLGRPLPRTATGEPVLPDDLAVTPEWALETAQRLLDTDRPFHAHEVLEAAWKTAEPADRDLWQGLAQLAVGLTHALRGSSAAPPRCCAAAPAGWLATVAPARTGSTPTG